MRIAVMQPYLFPYIGYWQLLNAVETFVIFDDVNYFKKGYINRNSILNSGESKRITLELIGASQNKLINEIEIGHNAMSLEKNIIQSYSKAPEYLAVFPIIQSILGCTEKNLAKFIGNSIMVIANYLEIKSRIIYSSHVDKDNDLKGQNKILQICSILHSSHYINMAGGQHLYTKRDFAEAGVRLSFLEPDTIEYKQYLSHYVSNLSIIDVMMFNPIDAIQDMLNGYKLI